LFLLIAESSFADVQLKITARPTFEADSFMADIIVWRHGMGDVYVLMDHHEFVSTGEMLSVLERSRAYLLTLFEVGL
jgi:hypothetical protein